ncbi:MAG: aminotransferase class V-fold PLP-dependent enzyme, partial [Anaerolineaceae bacterium]|nr:aminotransferase class V-fold PLP-dependent enzyme [Anaerolineaceae bacterium]
GAHAPSQVDVDLDALDCDFYIGACHKWMCAPKGAAFAYVNPAYHEILSPIVVSSGWVGCAHNPVPEGISSLVHYQEYQGTRDISAFLTVPTAIEYQQSHDWEAQRARCHQLAARTQEEMCAITGLEPFSPGTPEFVGQFVAVPLPDGNWEAFAEHVRERKIVVPVFPLQGHNQNMMRVSYQAYNDENDMDRLLEALKDGLSLF